MSSARKRCPQCGSEEDDPDIRFCAKDGTPLEPIEEPSGDGIIGRVIHDRYRVIERIGEGGMGSV